MAQIEICISDNASTDETCDIVKDWQQRLPSMNISYQVNTENLGADKNYLKSIEMANGKYCWFFGSDDKFLPNAIDTMLNSLNTIPEETLIIPNQKCYNFDFTQTVFCNAHPYFQMKSNQLCRTIDAFTDFNPLALGFLSILCFPRSRWNDALKDKRYTDFIGSAYVHMYILLSMIQKGLPVLFLSEKIVGWRAGNDFFLSELKEFGRIKIDIIGYSDIAQAVCGKHSVSFRNINNQVLKYIISPKMLEIGLTFKDDQKKELRALMVQYYKLFPYFWIHIFPYLILRQNDFLLLQKVYRLTLKPIMSIMKK